jgi:hypothetical protein
MMTIRPRTAALKSYTRAPNAKRKSDEEQACGTVEELANEGLGMPKAACSLV